ncbi:SGNH/GDSL hydrolase family protein [Vagococcus fessus]|uniref:SGNH hydrolase-type esterase domain-containing protein n=1 Tax=Vagococcus fessus TaxID=120370 RepID=A0A430A8V2_9ENTE|nr:GDSL-type esterase/lipase family protein [Vagococcus fessus]RSU03491.1 hypothetical protein CBF31_07205 [Vagococcus fessus]
MTKLFLFGDSITAGYGDEGITDELTKRVQCAFPDTDVINAGIPGDTTAGALNRIEEHILRYNPDEVVVFFGANDVANYVGVSPVDYRRNLLEIIERIGKEKVVLLSGPYTGQKRHGEDRSLVAIKQYVAVAETVACETGVPFVNLLEAMEKEADVMALLQEDELHFSDKGYDFLARIINQEIVKKRQGE